jgi:DNA-directed RNA polymerase specialized sigma24 family protein
MRSKFSLWVFKIAVNILNDRFKRLKKEKYTERLDERLKKSFQDSKSLWEDPENLESDLKRRSKELLNNALKKLSDEGGRFLKRDPMAIYLVN